jgi:hypothetical protein
MDHIDQKYEEGNQLHYEETRKMALNRAKSAATVTTSPELFEKLYLQPQTAVAGDLRKTFGNPTPLLVPCACLVAIARMD